MWDCFIFMGVIFLGFVIWGVIYLMVYFLSWFEEYGYDLSFMIDVWYVNDVMLGLVWDLMIVVIVLMVWVLVECIYECCWLGFLVIFVIFMIGVSCGLFLFLFLCGLW